MPWQLPADLPPGRYVVPVGAPEGTAPVLWVTSQLQPEPGQQWARLYRCRGVAGADGHRPGQDRAVSLWPLVLTPLAGEPHRPWHDGELDPVTLTEVDRVGAEQTLSQLWHALTDDAQYILDDLARLPVSTADLPPAPWHDTTIEFGLPAKWPGLAPPSLADGDPDQIAATVATSVLTEGYLGLVPASRGSDAVAVLGWDGAINYTGVAELAAVLRSWEDRFAVRLVGLGFDTMELSVGAPPATLEHARTVAAEHYALCPDNIALGPEDFELYARHIVGARTWSFWWD